MTEERTRQRKRVQGLVKSDKMDRTITVTIERLVKHPLYGKYLHRSFTFMAHDPHEDAREGDLVELESTRPLSKRKRWRLVRILRRAPQLEVQEPLAGTADSEMPA